MKGYNIVFNILIINILISPFGGTTEVEKASSENVQKVLDIKKSNPDEQVKVSGKSSKNNTIKTSEKKRDENFIPSEEISEDLAVSFPVDI